MCDERDKYRSDVWCEEWCRGLPEGCISDDRIDDGYYGGVNPESLVQQECHRRDSRRTEEQAQAAWEEEQLRQAYEEEKYYAEHEEEEE